MYRLTVQTFNILAPVFAHPTLYPSNSSELLDVKTRLDLITQELKLVRADIIALQEVTLTTDGLAKNGYYHRDGTLEYIINEFSDYWVGFVPHDRSYWADYYVDDRNSPQAYQINGNALLLRKSRFPQEPEWFDLEQSTGNHALLGVALDSWSQKSLGVLSIHLDSDVLKNRRTEFQEILSSAHEFKVDLVMGDFNAWIASPNFMVADKPLNSGFEDKPLNSGFEDKPLNSGFEDRSGEHSLSLDSTYFRDTSLDLKQNNRYTCPNTCTRCHGVVYGPIDHILYSPTQLIPELAEVRDFDLWTKYPYQGGYDKKEDDRIRETLGSNGSDHFSVVALFQIPL